MDVPGALALAEHHFFQARAEIMYSPGSFKMYDQEGDVRLH